MKLKIPHRQANLFWFLGFLLLPQLCWANMAVGGVFQLVPFVAAVFAFLLVWLIEDLVLLRFFPEQPKLALLSALIVNLASTAVGYLLVNFSSFFFRWLNDTFIAISILYIGTIIIEIPLWRLLYRHASWSRLIKAGLAANFFSYIFLVLFIMGDVVFLGDIIFVPAVIILLINAVMRLFGWDKKLSKQRLELVKMAFFFPLFVLLILCLIIFAFPPRTNRARDTRVKTALAQMRTVMVYTYGNYGSYDSFGTTSEDIAALASDVARNAYQDGKTQDLNITRWPNENSTSCCIYARLYEKQGKTWFCVDSFGKAGVVDQDPSKDEYCGTSTGVTVRCPPIIE